jgi:hypothetical protein
VPASEARYLQWCVTRPFVWCVGGTVQRLVLTRTCVLQQPQLDDISEESMSEKGDDLSAATEEAVQAMMNLQHNIPSEVSGAAPMRHVCVVVVQAVSLALVGWWGLSDVPVAGDSICMSAVSKALWLYRTSR